MTITRGKNQGQRLGRQVVQKLEWKETDGHYRFRYVSRYAVGYCTDSPIAAC